MSGIERSAVPPNESLRSPKGQGAATADLDWLAALRRYLATDEPVAVATVVATWGSAPRPPGAKMLVGASGRLMGSVSGGCVENEVALAAQAAMGDGAARVLRYGVADETAWAVGLSCGGTMLVWVEPGEMWRGALAPMAGAVAARQAVAAVTRLSPEAEPKAVVTSRSAQGTEPAVAIGRGAIAAGRCQLIEESGEPAWFADVVMPVPRLVVVGAGHLAEALVPLAAGIGFETHLVDPRSGLIPPRAYPEGTSIHVSWPAEALEALGPDPYTYVVALSHDDKIDVPALATALRSPAGYVGALGGRKTQKRRREALAATGVSATDMARLRGPVGLPLGAKGASEIAMSVAAELLAVRRGAQPAGAGD